VVLFQAAVQRKAAERDVVASTPYRPPVPAATRKGGLRLRWHLAGAGALLGLTVAAGIALTSLSARPQVEVGFSAPEPAVQAPADVRLVLEREGARVRLESGGAVVWRGRGPIDCITGQRVRGLRDGAGLVDRACVRLRDGAVVGLAGRVPPGAEVLVR
jgi:hypothetical protein